MPASPLIVSNYYFDRVNIASFLVSPEILTVIGNKVFTKKFIDSKSVLVLKDEYQQRRFIASNDHPLMDDEICIPLTNKLLVICTKFITFG